VVLVFITDKYKVERTKEHTVFGLGAELEKVKVTNTETGKSATAAKWDYDKSGRDLLQEAKDKLKANE
jgi:hypothetical protein